ncbi:MAG: DNA polymerase I [Lachnospiraceae bacterium]|nr:DNA polymerase I [Lachnospiraceae bacterium]
MEKLVLIDGHSILNRAYYGVPTLTNQEGLHTNAIYGFLNILFKIVDEENPTHLVVAFDVKAPTFRHKMYAEYKGTRKPMDEELREQVPVIKEVLNAMNIKIVELPGFEADDILGTLAKCGECNNMSVSLVSGDRDLLQIATDVIKIRIPKTKGGKTEIEDYYAKDVFEKYQVTPKGFIELKALMGDTADNIPGVPKVGEKTATELMVTFGSLDGIYEHVEEITKKAVKESLINNKNLADLSLKLATINVNAPVDITFEDALIKDFFTDEAFVLFKKLEFKNLLSKFDKDTKIDYLKITSSFSLIDDINKLNDWKRGVLESSLESVGVSIIYDNVSNDFLGVSIAALEKTVFIKKWLFLTEDMIVSCLKEVIEKCERVVTHHIKNLYLYAEYSEGKFDDVIIGSYLLNPLKNDTTVIDVANDMLGLLLPDRTQLFKKLSLEEAMEKHEDEFLNYVCYEAYVCLKSKDVIGDKLKSKGLIDLYENVEMPLSYVLFDMEKCGIRVIKEKLKDYSLMLGNNIEKLESEIYSFAGLQFNINSPKQLGEVLFETLGLPGGKKTKTGYSTAADVLEKLKPDYPIVKNILDYRAYSKLKSTYADGLVQYIDENDRIHSTFQQTVTATGRLSSTEPNLQNIPIRMDLGRQIRKVFVPKDGYIFLDADYSQIELRVLASMAEDENLIKAYSEHADIHRITASQVFHIPFDEVTDLQRRNAKAVNFGIVYGISAFGLGEDLGISPKEAKVYIEDYFKTYPKIKEFLDKQVMDAKQYGFTKTYYGRIRPIPELNSSNFMQRSFGERVAMNSPIQGTAADIIKIAMVKVYNRLKSENLKSKLILQVHDELLIETAIEEKDIVEKILSEEMTEASDLRVKLEIDCHSGNDWYVAK